MEKIKHIFLIDRIELKKISLIGLLFFFIAPGCIQPSDDDLFEPSLPSVVIEGLITDSLPPYWVKVSWSVSGESETSFLPIDSAEVTLSDNVGNTEHLTWMGNGLYQASSIQGIMGNEYNLQVEVSGAIFTASEQMRQKPVIDSISIAYQEITVPDKGYYITIHGHRPNNTVNFYKLDLQTTDTVYNGYSDLLIWEDSRAVPEQTVTIPYAFNPNDTVYLTIYSITESMYNYYNGLLKQTQNNFSNIQPPKLNPPTNISSEPLGYFQVSPITTLMVVIDMK